MRVINMNGLPRFTVNNDGGGFHGDRIKNADNTPDDLIRSDDKHFRPADPQIGPDGALWFGDWANALIGHMQYSQRDPNRDHTRGRIYRLVYPSRPVRSVTQFNLFRRFWNSCENTNGEPIIVLVANCMIEQVQKSFLPLQHG